MNEKLTEFEKILKNFEKVYESVTQSSLQSKVFIGGVIILTFLILMVNLCQYRRQNRRIFRTRMNPSSVTETTEVTTETYDLYSEA